MTIVEISVEYSNLLTQGNYSSIKPGLTITARIEEGDDPQAVIDQLRVVIRFLNEQAKAHVTQAEMEQQRVK